MQMQGFGQRRIGMVTADRQADTGTMEQAEIVPQDLSGRFS